jgi:hypothetical protein
MKDLGIPVALAVAFVLGGCAPIGSGNIVTESRDVDSFESVEVEAGIQVDLIVDPTATGRVDVVYDDNLQDRVAVSVEEGVLRISANGNLSTIGEGRAVTVVTPGLVGLTMSGGSQVDADGALDDLDLDVSGGSAADLDDLVVANLVVDISGGSSARVHASASVAGDVGSGSSLAIHGDPTVNDVVASAGAKVDY